MTDKTNSLSDARIRGKRVRDEETELLAKEGSQAVLKEREAKRAKKEEKRAKKEETKAKKEEEKEKKRRAKGKGTEVALVTTRDSDGTADNTDELLRVAEVIKDETRCKELIILLHHCTGAPRSKLQTMDLDELEDAWAKASKSTVAQAVPSSLDTDKTDCTAKTAKGSVSKSQASTSKPKATPKPAFETPAKKLTASKVMPNKVSMVGSPLVAFEEAQAQSARAAQPTPVPKKRKLDGPVDRTESVQRLRLDKPLPQVTAVSKSQSSTSTASASSKAPSPPPARSESFALSLNNKMGSNNDGGPGIDPDEEKPTRGGGGPRQRPTKKAMKNTIEGMITDIAVDRIWTGLVPNMCLESDEYALAILNGWRDAVEELGLSVKDYPLSADSKSVIRGLISSNRSRGRKRVAEALVDYFKLRVSLTNSLDNIKSRAAELKPTEFHCDSTETNKRAGAYRSPFISRALSAYWYTGPNSPGLRHPEALKPVPIEAIAFICGLSEDVLGGLERDGQLLTEVKAKKGEGQGRRAAKKPKEDIVPRANLDAVKPLMAVHLRNLQMFRTTLPGIFKDYRYTLHNDALKHVGKPASEPKPEVDSNLAAGALTADAFADEVDIPIAEVKRRHGSENPTARQPVSKPRQKVAPIPEHRQLPMVPEETSDSSSDSGSDSSSSSSSSSGSGSSSGSSPDSSSESSSSCDQDFGNNPSPTRKLVNPNTDHVYEPLDSMYDEVAPEEPGDVNEDAAPPEENREGGEQEGEDREKGDQEEEKVGDEWKEGTEASGEKDGSKDRVEEKATATVQGREKPNKDAQGIPPGHSMHEAPAELCGKGDPAKTCGPPPGPTSTPPPDTTLSPPLAPSPKAVPLATRVTRLTTKGTAPLGNMQVSPSRAAGVNASFAAGLERLRQDAQAKSGQKTEQKQPGKTKGAPKANRAAENRAAKAAEKAAKEAAEEETGAKKPKPKRGKKA